MARDEQANRSIFRMSQKPGITERMKLALRVYRDGMPTRYNKASPIRFAEWRVNQPLWQITDLDTYIAEGFNSNALIYSAIMYKAKALSSVPLRAYTGERDALPGGGPQKAGVAISDLMTGMYSAVAILAAVTEREHTGQGRHIDMALFDTMVAMLANMNMNYLTTGKPPGRAGNAHQNIVPYQVFAASDGHVIVAVGNDGQFAKFCEVAGRPELARDAHYAKNADRVRNRAALVPLLEDLVRARPMAYWAEALEAAGVPCGPINDLKQVFENPQVQARGMRIDIDRADAGPVKLVANPIKASRTPPAYRLPPPRLGEHTDEVLTAVLGWDPARIEAARAAGAIGGARSGPAGA
jgi:crotonobetainyl-CoA:carnitine CoA-transferase CaiB-like acyl-CoA transferase